jgi:ferredoxin-thioredoxin reductase catalytic subunit
MPVDHARPWVIVPDPGVVSVMSRVLPSSLPPVGKSHCPCRALAEIPALERRRSLPPSTQVVVEPPVAVSGPQKPPSL